MTDTPAAPQPASSLPPEVEAGRTFAILSYALSLVSLPFLLVPLIMRDNEFSLYHAKQCLLLWLGAIAVGVAGSVLMPLFCIGTLVWFVGYPFLMVLDILGLINAIKGEQKPVPLIGKFAEDWFKGIKKA